jgi:hypothetical protein
LLEDVSAHPHLNVTRRIPAQNIHVAYLGKLVT